MKDNIIDDFYLKLLDEAQSRAIKRKRVAEMMIHRCDELRLIKPVIRALIKLCNDNLVRVEINRQCEDIREIISEARNLYIKKHNTGNCDLVIYVKIGRQWKQLPYKLGRRIPLKKFQSPGFSLAYFNERAYRR